MENHLENNLVYFPEFYPEYYLEYYKQYYDLGELQSCQCSQENGIAKYHGESCEMPGRDACAGSPCHNGGICKIIIQGEIQACFINIIKNFSKSKIMLKLHKNFECSCADGFNGDVCQFKTEQDH